LKLFKKILIANRAEIAVRIIRAAKDLGIKTASVYSEVDADAMHVKSSDEAYCIGKEALSESYLNINKIISVARKANCEAIHPGYGFLAENPDFVKACEDAGIIFIGPSSDIIALMGNKIQARKFIKNINVPLVEGATGKDFNTLIEAGLKITFPLLLKPAAGGGGKGMRIIYEKNQLREAIESTSREAKAYFGDSTVYIEKYLEEPRHIEFQILGDNFGNVVHVYERECSIQRRYQKIIEEAPSVTLTPDLREEMGKTAVKIAKEIGYNNAGTIEFLMDRNLDFYFLEMNTRIQVEHPVTELTTAIDLVKEQIYISAGNRLRYKQKDISQKGHAIEARIYAEDPTNNFLPSPGKIIYYREPKGKNIRIDSGIDNPCDVKGVFDPMISKLIVCGNNRKKTIGKLETALSDYIIHGIQTNIPYLVELSRTEEYRNNKISTTFCEKKTNGIIEKIYKRKKLFPEFVPILSYLIFILRRNNNKNIQVLKNKPFIWNYIGLWRSFIMIPFQLEEEKTVIIINGFKDNEFSFEFKNKNVLVKLNHLFDSEMNITVNNENFTVYISERDHMVAFVTCKGFTYEVSRLDSLPEEYVVDASDLGWVEESDFLTSPMPGKVIKINVKEGDEISRGQVLMIIEAMKMENNIIANREAIVQKINVSVNQMVEGGAPLIAFK
jgi:3-methylcrotonyl-CoA carboxylase alpha subunit